jgi:hypothetical protein
MIDHLMCLRAERAGYYTDPSYAADQAVRGFEFHGAQEGETLWVVCPPWLGGGKFVDILTSSLSENGSVLRPHLHDQIIEPNLKRVRDSYQYIQEQSLDEIEKYASNFDEVRLAILSLGHAMMFLITPHLNKLSRIHSVVGGASLAESLWEGKRTLPIRQQLEEDGVTFEEVDCTWKDIGIKNQAHGFKDKEINLLTSVADNIIPTAHQLELKKQLEKAGARVEHKKSRAGHYFTAARFCLTHFN